MRRIPVYIILDCTKGMSGSGTEHMRESLSKIIGTFRSNPVFLEHAYVSLVSLGSCAEQYLPLTELPEIKLPELSTSTHTCPMSFALHLVEMAVKHDLIRPNPSSHTRGDFPSFLIVLSNMASYDRDGAASEYLNRLRQVFKYIYVIGCGAKGAMVGVLRDNVICFDAQDGNIYEEIGHGICRSIFDSDLFETYESESYETLQLSYSAQSIAMNDRYDVSCAPGTGETVCYIRDSALKDKLQLAVNCYHRHLWAGEGGDVWKKLFLWPRGTIMDGEKVGFVVPSIPSHFIFQYGSTNQHALNLAKRGKEALYFTSPLCREKLDCRELGSWSNLFTLGMLISRSIRKLHASGMIYPALSSSTVLLDPPGGRICFPFDLDGLAIPKQTLPEIYGYPDFIAPELRASMNLPTNDGVKLLPSHETDLHSLAVLLYMLLLCRHPLRGRRICDHNDAERDEFLTLGKKALFIEHPIRRDNYYDIQWVKEKEEKRWNQLLPWWDLETLPYTILGPHLSPLVQQAFVEGLHMPAKRPTAEQWELAFIKTMDLLMPCQNPSCAQGWFVFDNTSHPRCPFCGTGFHGVLPILNLYSRRGLKSYHYDEHRIVAHPVRLLYAWHGNVNTVMNEKLSDRDKEPCGYIVYNGQWCLYNMKYDSMKDLTEGKDVPINSVVPLTDGKHIMLSSEEGRRVVQVQLIEN